MNAWKAIFFTVLFPLIDSVRTLCSVASNERITYSESSMPGHNGNGRQANGGGQDGRGNGGDTEYIIHYSRNTAFKQWAETVVLVLGGISRLLCIKLDLFLHSATLQTLAVDGGDSVISSTSTTSSSSSAQQQQADAESNILLNIWSLFFDFVYSSAVSSNAEVSTSALKCFNEIVHFLAEYQKTKTEAVIASEPSSSSTSAQAKVQALLRTLFPVWKIVWKTWCNIGHNVGPGKIQPQPPSTAEGSELPPTPPAAVSAATVLQQLPSQAFLCLLIKPLYYIFPKIASHFTDG